MGNDELADDLGPDRQAWSVSAPACKPEAQLAQILRNER
jgi:hypothetical protein